jgi:neurotransmitter:Na+ symporter, NSS family
MSDQKHNQWGTKLGVILAVAGSAVGLGNFLRFPGQAWQNGGGAFMIPYFCALLLVGIPIGWAEWTMGRYGGRKKFHSAPAIMGVVGKGSTARYLGVIGVLIPLAVFFYYNIIEAWCLGYFWKFATGGIGIAIDATVPVQVQQSADAFSSFTGSADHGVLWSGHWFETTWGFWLVTLVLNVWLLYRGLSGGIEKFCTYAMPLMGVIAIFVLVRVLTLGTPNPDQPEYNVLSGLGFMWNPDFEKLAEPKTWLAAAGQIFFSLSVGFGVIINYASYMKKRDDVVLSGLTASATNEYFEVAMGGMIALPAAFVFLGPLLTPQGTFGLGFQTLPVVFAHMPAGNLFGALFFLMLFLAAITSSLSMLQPTLAFIQEALGCSRKLAVTTVVAVALLGNAYILYYSKGGVAMDTIDFWVGTFLIFILAMVQIFCFGWVWGIDKAWKEMNTGAKLRLPSIMMFIMKYVSPLYLLVIFVMFCKENLGTSFDALMADSVAKNAMMLVGVVTLGLIALTAYGTKRWRAQGLDVDGEREPDDEEPAKGRN